MKSGIIKAIQLNNGLNLAIRDKATHSSTESTQEP